MTDIIEPVVPAIEKPTAEQIAQHYKAALDSVDLINSTKPEDTSAEDWADTIKRNKEHLNIMLAKDFWTKEDLTAIKKAAK
jgi:dihydrodipicolinate synthase/N-acetylneuraminate lyase